MCIRDSDDDDDDVNNDDDYDFVLLIVPGLYPPMPNVAAKRERVRVTKNSDWYSTIGELFKVSGLSYHGPAVRRRMVVMMNTWRTLSNIGSG